MSTLTFLRPTASETRLISADRSLGLPAGHPSSNFLPSSSTSSVRRAPCSASHALRTFTVGGLPRASTFASSEAQPEARSLALPTSRASRADTFQYSLGMNAAISRSRSTMRRTATDWTRPAERLRATFFHSNGETW